jgi:hypothetical protein
MPKRTSLLTKVIAGFFGLVVLVSIFNPKSKAPATAAPSPTSTATDTAKPIAAAAPAKPVRKPGAAVAAMAKSTDKIEKTDWYRDKTSPQYNNVNGVFAYMGATDSNVWLRLRFQYEAEDWLFIERAIIVVDGAKIGEATGRWERDNDSRVWEWLDVPVRDSEMAMVKAMAGAKEVTIRYEGQQYRKDRTLRPNEIKAFQRVLAAYKEMGGVI